ncbi:methionine synthase [Arachnia propionica]|uniref:Methionine synthase n=1 Tax=Arachnia propionica TaxID=1750 RepID=A0A3P1WZM0_9ACTN|nr:methionine synthase [Arachnia propionica]RRD49873.1 methionine synthase [Arachnia propionica]
MMRTTATGSLPGEDFRGALSTMAELLPDVLAWPELPARGVGSDMIGRALGVIDDLGFDLQPGGWRLTHHPGADHRRARSQWRRDLDDAEELLQGFEGVVKIAITGPWTLSGGVERPRGDRILADHGARAEVAEALWEGWCRLAAEIERRLPAVRLLLQVDEPLLVAVLDGTLPTASGFGRHRAVEPGEVADRLRRFADGAWLHCCASGSWVPIARRAEFGTVAVDSRLFRGAGIDTLAEWVHDGRGLVLGVVDTTLLRAQGVDVLRRETMRVLRPLELPVTDLTDRVILSTGCGLGGWPMAEVMPQLRSLGAAASLVEEEVGTP